MLLWRLRVSASPWPVGDRLAPSAYAAAFVVHAPVVVADLVAAAGLGPLAKFAVSGTLGVVLSFAWGGPRAACRGGSGALTGRRRATADG